MKRNCLSFEDKLRVVDYLRKSSELGDLFSNDVAELVKTDTGITVSSQQVGLYMRTLGLKWKGSGRGPQKTQPPGVKARIGKLEDTVELLSDRVHELEELLTAANA